MTEGNFVDYAAIYVRSGKGGAGSTHLRREKFVAMGGPDGGDGGRGGHILVQGDRNLWTLYHFKFKKHFKAQIGAAGGKSRSSGAQGDDILIKVPLGTLVKESDTGKLLFEVTGDEEKHMLARGGKGGRGNWHFKSATRQTPRYAQPGLEGEEKKITLELKVLADVGLVGFPNAGKSTLLAALTAAKPKIADYPFTTLKPNLGIVAHRDYTSFVMADIPGIIEGAAEGKGLGHYFLRHIERNSVLLFMVPADSEDVLKEYHILITELKKYNPQLLDKERILAVSKSDLLSEESRDKIIEKLQNLKQAQYLFISSVNETGLQQLKDALWKLLHN